MSERLPPAIAIFYSETVRRRVMPRLGARVPSVRYDPATSIKSAFVEELNQSMTKAAERLRPNVAPALSIVLITDPMLPPPDAAIIGLIRKACPPSISIVLQWVGVYRPLESWPRDGVTFLLSTTWRGGLIQGGSFDRAYQSLILSILATETSRVAPTDFDCFARLRFHSPGKIYKVAIDPIDLPNFEQQAETQLRAAALASYFPEIDDRAQAAAARLGPLPVIDPSGSRQAIEPAIVEPLLCAAIAQCITITQAAALLGDWAATATGAAADLLRDLQIALIHWASTQTITPAEKPLANGLFAAQPFPLLHELRPSSRTQQTFRNQTALRRVELINAKRAELDLHFYELLPNDMNAHQRLAVASELSHTNGSAARLTTTRHFPICLIQDTREEILDLPDLSTVLYAMEMRPQ